MTGFTVPPSTRKTAEALIFQDQRLQRFARHENAIGGESVFKPALCPRPPVRSETPYQAPPALAVTARKITQAGESAMTPLRAIRPQI
jgi:hypothetical protein